MGYSLYKQGFVRQILHTLAIRVKNNHNLKQNKKNLISELTKNKLYDYIANLSSSLSEAADKISDL